MHAIMELRRLGRRIFLSLIAVGLVLALMMLGGFADRMVLYPSTQPEDAMGAARVEVPFGGGRLEIWTARSRGARKREPERYVLSFEGNASRAEWMVTSDALQWKDRPVEQWTVNYPGYGGSTGPARLARRSSRPTWRGCGSVSHPLSPRIPPARRVRKSKNESVP